MPNFKTPKSGTKFINWKPGHGSKTFAPGRASIANATSIAWVQPDVIKTSSDDNL
jgi:hypothetical protein